MTDPLPRNTHKPNLKKLREIAKGLQGSEEPVQSEPLVPVSITREAFEKLLGWANFSDITISEAVIKHIDAPDSDSDTSSRANNEPVVQQATPESEELKSILHNLFTDAIEAYKGVPPTHNRTLSTANPIDIAMEDILQWRTKSLLALLDSILNKSDIAWVERGELRSHETFVHTNVIRDIKSKLGEDK